MPDVVTKEILKNLDFASIRKLRKVCRAFRDFIDCVKPDSNLESINLEVRADIIFTSFSTLSQSTEDIEFFYKEEDMFNGKNICLMERGFFCCATFENNCADLCVDDFLRPALKHQKSLLDELCVIKHLEFDENRQPVPQNPGKLFVPTFEKLFDGLINVLESRDRLLQVESLLISVHGQDQLMQLLRHVDLKVLQCLKVYRLLETEQFWEYGEDNSEFVLDLDILKDCENLEILIVRRFSVCSQLRMLTHIPNMKLSMQTIYYADVLRVIQTMEKSDIYARSEIRFEQFPDKSRFLEAIGLVEDDSVELVHVFPSKLILAYYPALKCIGLKWKHSS
ncbi:hypothetical protein CRE_19864 [Caenorhabditis remanei]|uniref:F-box domain-containing protein n=1 Tax=Caenorhabditis remanei TaxID=31234 RepID=E3MTD0_CAERE|nr:hypothetical protein CRE_19864 [Caenorhabditis remanei]